MRGQRLVFLVFCCLGLVACNTMNTQRGYSYESSDGFDDRADIAYFSPPPHTYSYTYSDEYGGDQADIKPSGRNVVVPETYHVGAYHSPVAAKDRDQAWVKGQDPNAYTIEIGDSEKASQVAGLLHQAPKKERVAEVPYFRNGSQHYKGLYGSYPSQEAAQQALTSLPESLKQQAGVKRWAEVQGNVE